MGTFAEYNGVIDIPDEKREEFAQSILTLLNEGGMMTFHRVKLYGKSIVLLSPLKIKSNGKVRFYYNYLEEDAWEDAYFNASSSFLHTEKIGDLAFNQTILACYRLYEYYTKSFGFVYEDDICYDDKTIGWINYVLKKQYAVERPKKLLDMYHFYLENKPDDEAQNSYDEIFGLGIEQIRDKVVNWSEFYSLLYVYGGLKNVYDYYDIKEETLKKLPIHSYNRQLPILEKFIKESHTNLKYSLKKLFEYIQKSENIDYCEFESKESMKFYFELINRMSYVSRSMLIKAIADEYKQDFWKLWNKSQKIWKDTKENTNNAVQEVPTGQFINAYPNSIITWGKRRKRDTYSYRPITDDNRLFFYEKDRTFNFSPQLLEWLDTISKRFNDSLSNVPTYLTSDDYIKDLVNTCHTFNNTNNILEIYLFKNTFYEMLNNSDSNPHKSALQLLKILFSEIPQGNFGDWKNEYYYNNTHYSKKKDNFHDQRLKVKLYIALLANPELRKKYLNF